MKRSRCSFADKTLRLAVLVTLVGGLVVAGASTSGATSKNDGVITGRVSGCGPGPIVASPDPAVPTAKPISVKVVRDGRTYATEMVKLPKNLPWSGTFRFSVPPDRYEVISSYRGVGRWVSVRPGVPSEAVRVGCLPR
jgi:hypothetical protein